MYYIINIIETEKAYMYSLYDTNTESRWTVDMRFINKYNIKLENAKIIDNKIQMNPGWENIAQSTEYGRAYGNDYIITSIYSTGVYKCVKWIGDIHYTNDFELDDTKGVHVANLREATNESETVQERVIEAEYIDTSQEFIDKINNQYKLFLAKSKILGKDMSFEYIIENNNVILKNYTGKSDKPVIPKFITSIGAGAFSHSAISAITLNEGLRFIGVEAFMYTGIQKLVVPSTVEYIGIRAFLGCKRLYNKLDEVMNIELVNNNTIIYEN